MNTEFISSEVLKIKHKKDFLIFARMTGLKLIRAKSKCERGEWIGFMTNNTPYSVRQCQKYMRIASQYSQIPKEENFTIDQAFDYLISLEKK